MIYLSKSKDFPEKLCKFKGLASASPYDHPILKVEYNANLTNDEGFQPSLNALMKSHQKQIHQALVKYKHAKIDQLKLELNYDFVIRNFRNEVSNISKQVAQNHNEANELNNEIKVACYWIEVELPYGAASSKTMDKAKLALEFQFPGTNPFEAKPCKVSLFVNSDLSFLDQSPSKDARYCLGQG